MFAASMAVFGTLGLFTRNIEVSSGELALVRAVLAAVLIGIYMLISGQRICFSRIKKELLLLLISGMAMGINWVLLFEAYRYTSISVATLSYYFAPVIVTVLSPLLFKERMTARQVICFLMSTAGLGLIIGADGLSGGSSNIKGIAFGLSAAVFYAAVMLLNKFIRDVEGIPRTFIQFIASLFVLIPYVMVTGGLRLSALSGLGWVCILTVGLVHTGVTYCMYFSSLKDLRGQEAAILSYIDPLVAVIVSALFLKEQMLPMQIIGGAMILGFTIWNELSDGKEQ